MSKSTPPPSSRLSASHILHPGTKPYRKTHLLRSSSDNHYNAHRKPASDHHGSSLLSKWTTKRTSWDGSTLMIILGNWQGREWCCRDPDDVSRSRPEIRNPRASPKISDFRVVNLNEMQYITVTIIINKWISQISPAKCPLYFYDFPQQNKTQPVQFWIRNTYIHSHYVNFQFTIHTLSDKLQMNAIRS